MVGTLQQVITGLTVQEELQALQREGLCLECTGTVRFRLWTVGVRPPWVAKGIISDFSDMVPQRATIERAGEWMRDGMIKHPAQR